MALRTSPSPSYRPQALPRALPSPWLVAQVFGHHSRRRSLAPLHPLVRHQNRATAHATPEFFGAYARLVQPPPRPPLFDPLLLSPILTNDPGHTPQLRTSSKPPTANTASFRTPAQRSSPISSASLVRIKRLAGSLLTSAVVQEPFSTSIMSGFDVSRFSRQINPIAPPPDVGAKSFQIAANSTYFDTGHRRRTGSTDVNQTRAGSKPPLVKQWAPTSLTPPEFLSPSGPSASLDGRRLPIDPRGIEGDTRSASAEQKEVHIDGHALGQWITSHLGQALSCPPTSGSFALNHGLALLPGQSLLA